MRSSSPVNSSPIQSPLKAGPSKRFVSKVYSRRSIGNSSAKQARRTPTPESDTDSGEGEIIATAIPVAATEDDDMEGAAGSSAGRRRITRGQERARQASDQRRGREEQLAWPSAGKEVRGKTAVRASGKDAGTRESPALRGGISLSPGDETAAILSGETGRTRGAKRKLGIPRTGTETSIASAPEVPSPRVSIPPIMVQAATSSPSILSSSLPRPSSHQPVPPSTPPRKRPKRHGPLTPQSSPRDLSALFAPVSPARSPVRSPALSRRNTAGDDSDGGIAKRPAGGLFRRMLDKTQSLGAIASPAKEGEDDYFTSTSASPSPSKALTRTNSLPTTPSRSPLKPEGAPNAMAQTLIVPVASSSRLEASTSTSGGKAKRTYGRSRTILAEVTDSPRSGASSNGAEKDTIKESYAELRKQFEVDNTGGDESGPGNLMLDLLAVRGGQSVSDLRSKGENRRFMDELGYLVDPITDPGTGVGLKRSSILDILRSMQDEDWLQRAKICGQVEQIWEAIYGARGEKGDETIEAMCLLYLANLVKSGSGLELVLRAHEESCERIVLGALKVRDGPLDEVCRVKTNGLVGKVRSMYQQLEMAWTSDIMSTRRLASLLLVEMTSPSVRMTTSSTSILISDKALSRIAKSLMLDMTELVGRFDLAEKGLPISPTDRKGGIDIDHISQSLTVLSRLIGYGVADLKALGEMHATIAPTIINALIAGISLAMDKISDATSAGSTIAIQSLQILATMSNTTPSWASAISDVEGGLVSLGRVLLHRSALAAIPTAKGATGGEGVEDGDEEEDEGARFFSPKKRRASTPRQDQIGEEDLLCLVLVILTASIMGSEEAVSRLAAIRLGSGCRPHSKACLRTCRCVDAEAIPVHLVRTYLDQINSETPSASLIAAYIALILSKLIPLDNTLLAPLPGDSDRAKLLGLIDVLSSLSGLQTFLQTRLKLAAGSQGGEQDMEVGGGEAGRRGGDEGVVDEAIDDLRRMAEGMEG